MFDKQRLTEALGKEALEGRFDLFVELQNHHTDEQKINEMVNKILVPEKKFANIFELLRGFYNVERFANIIKWQKEKEKKELEKNINEELESLKKTLNEMLSSPKSSNKLSWVCLI